MFNYFILYNFTIFFLIFLKLILFIIDVGRSLVKSSPATGSLSLQDVSSIGHPHASTSLNNALGTQGYVAKKKKAHKNNNDDDNMFVCLIYINIFLFFFFKKSSSRGARTGPPFLSRSDSDVSSSSIAAALHTAPTPSDPALDSIR